MKLVLVYISVALLSEISCSTETETKTFIAIRNLAREVLLLRRMIAGLQRQKLQKHVNPTTLNNMADGSTVGTSEKKRGSGRCINGCLQRGGVSFIRCKAMCRRRR